jgi:AcrR family transcriptional regulator
MKEKYQNRQNEIIKAAQKRFIKHGLQKTTIDEIARDLRIGKSSLYHYFHTKEELYYRTIETEKNGFLADVLTVFDNPEIAIEEQFAQYLKIKSEMPQNYKLLYRLILHFLAGESNQLEDDLFLRFYNDEIKLLSKKLGSLFPAGETGDEPAHKHCPPLISNAVSLIAGLQATINEKTDAFVNESSCVDLFIEQYKKLSPRLYRNDLTVSIAVSDG